ncbi:hypothetical protein B0J11DRAFT_522500 [Dendryphion nanum]|uniref:Peptidase C15, pyroglutamyl peptidase I-like protein n=1 Tax=Dendryphion nanum TaxID=256645 RepID=A0A9P9IT78_9PLEO|nr:hypothetical protein B0J11DRAFT_522500 [Dendryphion nanum]
MPPKPSTTKVLVTGFGPFNNHPSNPSWTLTHALPSTHPKDPKITIATPPSPLTSAYHDILTAVQTLYTEHDPDIVLHIGLDDTPGDVRFKVEKSALREGYHELPDRKRRVFTRGENKTVFGKGPARLETGFDVGETVEAWEERVRGLKLAGAGSGGGEKVVGGKGKGKGMAGTQVEVVESDDVGNYTCGFIYYVGLSEMGKRRRKGDVVFLHVPWLESEEDVRVGVRVVEELIGVLVEGWKGR